MATHRAGAGVASLSLSCLSLANDKSRYIFVSGGQKTISTPKHDVFNLLRVLQHDVSKVQHVLFRHDSMVCRGASHVHHFDENVIAVPLGP